MTSYERFDNAFKGKPVDRLPICEDFWGETLEKWTEEGHLKQDEAPWEHFDLDMERHGLVNWYADPYAKPIILEETEDIVLFKDGNHATLREFKRKAGGVEHVSYSITEPEDFERLVKPHILMVNEDRIPFEEYGKLKTALEKKNKVLFADAFGPFELLQRLMGHEELLVNMALDPDWVGEMVMLYCEFNIMHWERLFEKAGTPYGMWIADDLGYKETPFMSKAMFDEMYIPGFKRMFDYLHSKGVVVMLHSCGFVEPLLGSLVEAGLDCLEAMEFKAGMDIHRIQKEHGDKIAYCGNIDMRVLESNDTSAIKKELEDKILPVLDKGGRFILHSDHSVSPKVEYETFCEYLRIAHELI